MNRRFALTPLGRDQLNNLLREVGLDPNQTCSASVSFDATGVAILTTETYVGDDGLDFLKLAVRSPEADSE